MDTSLDHLTPEFRPLAMELIARCVESGIHVVIINTLRSKAEQQAAIASGSSWTTKSKHLPQAPSGLSDAIDIAPLAQYIQHGSVKVNWNGSDPAWAKMIAIGEAIGLRSGKSFPKPDLGHFEYVERSSAKAAGVQ